MVGRPPAKRGKIDLRPAAQHHDAVVSFNHFERRLSVEIIHHFVAEGVL